MSRILVIDDEAGIRTVLQAMLVRDGHTVVCAENGAAGLEAFGRDRPDLVVTDIFMPEKEGIETIREIRKTDPVVPIIAMSGGGRNSDTDFLPLAAKFGAVATLTKPFDATTVLTLVRRILSTIDRS